MKQTIAVLCLLASSLSFLPAQNWMKTYGGTQKDRAESIIPLGNDFLIIGTTESFQSNNQDIYLIKTNAQGQQQSSTLIGDEHFNTAEDAILTTDNHILIGSSTCPTGGSCITVIPMLVKTDLEGNTIWMKTFPTASSTFINAIIESADGNYLFTGRSDSGQLYLIKTDTNGNEIWSTVLANNTGDGRDLLELPDGNIIVSGRDFDQAVLAKFDPLGNNLWLNKMQTEDGFGFIFESVIYTLDGNLAITGPHYTQFEERRTHLVKTDLDGNQIWVQNYADLSFANQVIPTPEGGYAITGGASDGLYLQKLDNLGNQSWLQTYAGNSDIGNALILCPDNRYLLAGFTDNFGLGGNDFVLIKTEGLPIINGEVKGIVYEDVNENCTSDDDIFLADITIQLSNEVNDWFYQTTTDGAFQFLVPPGGYTLSIVTPTNYAACTESYFITVDAGPTNNNYAFGLTENVQPDAGITAVTEPTNPFASGNQSIEVTLTNFTALPLNTVQVNWTLNGITQPVIDWTGALSFEQTANLNLGNGNFSPDQANQLVAWTSLPNATPDSNPLNDTLIINLYPALDGTYYIGGNDADFENFTTATNALLERGVSGSVTFKIRPGLYLENIELTAIPGASETKTVTFESEDLAVDSVELRGNVSALKLNGAAHLNFHKISFATSAIQNIVRIENGAAQLQFTDNKFYAFNYTTNAIIVNNNVPNHYLSFIGNEFLECGTGIHITNTDQQSQGWIIENNHFKDQSIRSIFLSDLKDVIIRNNKFDFNNFNGNAIEIFDGFGYQILNNQITIATQGSGVIQENAIEGYGTIANNMIYFSGNIAASGIRIRHDSVNVLYNSVVCNNTHPESQPIFLDFSAEQTRVLNNNFINLHDGPAFYTQNNLAVDTIDHNNYFSNGPNLAFWNQPISNLVTLQQFNTHNINSINILPFFDLLPDLHLQDARLDGQGMVLIDIKKDIDFQTRSTIAPDIGADEFELPELCSNFTGIPNPVMPFLNGLQEVKIDLINNGSEAIQSFQLGWSINEEEQTLYSNSDLLTSGTSVNNLIIGTYDFKPGLPYFIRVWNNATTICQDTILSDTLFAALSGIYTIGGFDPNFETFNDAAYALDKGGVLGPVIFKVRDGVYNEQFILQNINGTSSINTITFESETGNSEAVVLEFAANNANENYILFLNGINHLTLKNLTFQANGTSFGNLINSANENLHLHLEGNRFIGKETINNSNHSLVHLKGGYIFADDNYFKNGAIGLYVDLNNPDFSFAEIKNNDFQNTYSEGIGSSDGDSLIIVNNQITTTSNYQYFNGIYVRSIRNLLQLSSNKIQFQRGNGIDAGQLSKSGIFPMHIDNNSITILGDQKAYGISIDRSDHTKVLFNSINCVNSHPDTRATLIDIDNFNLDFYNNILVNSGGAPALEIKANNDWTADHNNYFAIGNPIIIQESNPYANLSEWNVSSNQDANSFELDPLFFSTTDLHASGVHLDGNALPFLEITTDCDGDLRSNNPDIGADEFTTGIDLSLVSIDHPTAIGCSLGATEFIAVTLFNRGAVTVDNFTIAYQINNGTVISEEVANADLEQNDSLVYTFTTSANFADLGQYDIVITVTTVGDTETNNNQLNLAMTHFLAPTKPTNLIPLDNTSALFKPITFSWAPANHANFYEYYLWPDTSIQPNAPLYPNLQQISFSYNGQAIQPNNSYHWQIVAKNENCSTPSDVLIFNTSELPDLVVDTILVPTAPSAGQEIQITYTIKNQGNGATNTNWYEEIFLSADTILNITSLDFTDPLLLGANNLEALAAGENYTQTKTVTIPDGIAGNYEIFVYVNRNSLGQKEVDKTNNYTFASMPIQNTDYPDLQVVSVGAPINAFSDTDIEVTWIVKNEGENNTSENNWKDRVYLGTFQNESLDDAVPLVTFTHTGDLEKDSIYTRTATIHLPIGVSGTHFIKVETDNSDAVFEQGNESNNVAPSNQIDIAPKPTPNLLISNFTTVPTVSNREMINLSWHVFNQTNIPTSNNWTDRIYISDQPTLGVGNDFFLGAVAHQGILNFEEDYIQNLPVIIPDEITGDYYFILQVDFHNQVFENTESDNLQSVATIVQTPDLTIRNIETETIISSGTTTNISWSSHNKGIGQLIPINRTDKIYLSLTNILETTTAILIDSFTYSSGLLAQDSIIRQKESWIPNGLEGDYYLIIQTDANQVVYEEAFEGNNIHVKPIEILLSPSPDLIINESSTLPASANPGDLITIDFSIINNGSVVAEGNWFDHLYLSDSLLTEVDSSFQLATFERFIPLPSGDIYNLSSTFKIPFAAMTETGYYFIYIKTDATDLLYEHADANDNNLTLADSIFIAVPPRPDLAIINATSAMDSVVTGENLLVDLTIENLGNDMSIWGSSTWTDALYLSEDLIIDSTDFLLSSWSQINGLNINEQYQHQATVHIPDGLEGEYYLLAITDQDQNAFDSDRSNNQIVLNGHPIYIISKNYSDLEIVSLILPGVIIAGQPVEAIWTIKNNGQATTTAESWRDMFIINQNANLFNGQQLKEVTFKDSLSVGQSYTDTTTFIIPSNYSGNKIIQLKTDRINQEFENNEDNNIAIFPIEIVIPPLSDLIVNSITVPSDAMAGESITINWQIHNQGNNPAQGARRDIVYISKDTVWDSDDIIFGTLDINSNLPPLGSEEQSLTGPLPSLAQDDYYIIIRTDIQENIFETDETNNLNISNTTINISINELFLDVLETNTLPPEEGIYYFIDIPAELIGKTLLLTINGDENGGANELFMRYADIPSRSNHDFSGSIPNEHYQELIIPSLQSGRYYILAYGTHQQSQIQSVDLLATILPFQIREVRDDQGGNTGNVTLLLKGALFEETMSIELRDPILGNIIPENIFVVNSTKAFVTFNLRNKPLGFYDVYAERLDGETALVPDAFEIIAGDAVSDLGNGFSCSIESIGANALLNTNVYNVPAYNRPGDIIPITIAFANDGTVDIPTPNRLLISMSDRPVAYTSDGFDPDNFVYELRIEFKEFEGPPDILRPGASGSITVYTWAYKFGDYTLILK